MKTIGFVVIEAADEFEQILALEVGDGLPPGGILVWAPQAKRTIFSSRSGARAAIDRTERYRLAFGMNYLPERSLCRVEPIGAADDFLAPRS